MKVLVTGGAGFIGSHFVRHLLRRHPEYDVLVLDNLTYAGRLENLHDVMDGIQFRRVDICDEREVYEAVKGCRLLFNFAAESHVDRSIEDAGSFVRTNVWGTYVLLEAAKTNKLERFVQISTDEVYGSRLRGSFQELDPLSPSSPYAASKAAADLLALSYSKTFGIPVVITRSSNNFGPYQYPEKLIPLFILNAFDNTRLPLYGDGRNVRDWIYVDENCAAIDLVAQKGISGEIYNVASKAERENLAIAELILKTTNRSNRLIEPVEDRLGHDQRYALDTRKIENLGWSSAANLEDRLKETVEWYRSNEWWWRPLRNGL